jgi:hypothetical protein
VTGSRANFRFRTRRGWPVGPVTIAQSDPVVTVAPTRAIWLLEELALRRPTFDGLVGTGTSASESIAVIVVHSECPPMFRNSGEELSSEPGGSFTRGAIVLLTTLGVAALFCDRWPGGRVRSWSKGSPLCFSVIGHHEIRISS